MEKVDYAFIQTVEEVFSLETNIMELGARVIGTQGDRGIRKIFGEKNNKGNYIGLDYMEGPGVDMVTNVQSIPLPDKSVKSIIALNLFEHVEKFWLVFDEMKRLIDEQGTIVCATPFSYDIHACPYDYFRFTPYFYESQFKAFKYRLHMTIGSEKRPKMVYAIASNNQKLEERFPQFQRLMTERYRKLIPGHKQWLFRLRSCFCGNHFKDAIRNFGGIKIELVSDDNLPEGWA